MFPKASNIGSDGSPARSASLANIDTSAERRILEMVAGKSNNLQLMIFFLYRCF